MRKSTNILTIVRPSLKTSIGMYQTTKQGGYQFLLLYRACW